MEYERESDVVEYKTKGGVSPSGKPMVYITAHSCDMPLYFNTVSEMILNSFDCTICYNNDPEEPYRIKDIDVFLMQCRLVVIIVTSKFTDEDSCAYRKIFQMAMDMKKPVLPIMMENGIEQRFNEKCGNLQILDPFSADVTALSFESKLKKYLDTVLYDQNTAKKVKRAFSAYIFVSYRKKDRAYARKMMKLIHNFDFCRDIALWYDEFLTPGKDFEKSIRSALKKSQVFALAITPNLVCEPNYVQQIEYPMAVNLYKKVLPVEMKKTDRNALSIQYPNISEPLSPDNKVQLEKALRQYLSLYIRKSDDSPEHIYLIGLANLMGIDMEINTENAVKMISSAADQLYKPAVKKLAEMFSSGDGVKPDYIRAADYYQRLACITEDEFNTNGEELSAVEYLDQLTLAAEFMYRAGKYTDAMVIYDRVRMKSKRFMRFFESGLIIVMYIRSLVLISEYYDLFSNHIKAEKYALEALDNVELLSRYPSLDKRNITIAKFRIFISLSHISDNLGKIEKAIEYNKCLLELAHELKEKNMADSYVLYEETAARSALSLLYARLGKMEEAENYSPAGSFEASVGDEFSSLALKANSHYNAGMRFMEMREFKKAEEELYKSLEIYEKNYDNSSADTMLYASCGAYIALAKLYSDTGDLQRAMELTDKAYAIALKESSERKLNMWYGVLGKTMFIYGDIYSKKGEELKMLQCLLRCIDILSPIINSTASHSLKIDLLTAYANAILFYLQQNDYDNAENLALKADKLIDSEMTDDQDPFVKRLRMNVYNSFDIIYGNKNDIVRREYYAEKRRKIYGDEQEANISFSDFVMMTNQAIMLMNEQHLDDALEHLKNAENMVKTSPHLFRNAEELISVAHMYYYIGLVYFNKYDYGNSESYFYKSLDFLSSDPRFREISQRLEISSLCHGYMCQICLFQKNIIKARDHYNEAGRFLEEMERKYPGTDQIQRVRDFLNSIGKMIR